jgi:hypothetical protein
MYIYVDATGPSPPFDMSFSIFFLFFYWSFNISQYIIHPTFYPVSPPQAPDLGNRTFSSQGSNFRCQRWWGEGGREGGINDISAEGSRYHSNKKIKTRPFSRQFLNYFLISLFSSKWPSPGNQRDNRDKDSLYLLSLFHHPTSLSLRFFLFPFFCLLTVHQTSAISLQGLFIKRTDSRARKNGVHNIVHKHVTPSKNQNTEHMIQRKKMNMDNKTRRKNIQMKYVTKKSRT